MSIYLELTGCRDVNWPSGENKKAKIKIGPSTLAMNVENDDWNYEASLAYRVSAGIRIYLIAMPSNTIVAQGLIKHENILNDFVGSLQLEPRGQLDMRVIYSKAAPPSRFIRRKQNAAPTAKVSTRRDRRRPDSSHTTRDATPAGTPRITVTPPGPNFAVVSNVPVSQGNNQRQSPFYSQYLKNQFDNEAATNAGQMVVVAAGRDHGVAIEDVVMEEEDMFDAGLASLNWKGIQCCQVYIAGAKNLNYAGNIALGVRAQYGQHTKSTHVIQNPSTAPHWDCDIYFPVDKTASKVHYDVFDKVTSTVLATGTVDLRGMLLSSGGAKQWEGVVPLKGIGPVVDPSFRPSLHSSVAFTTTHVAKPIMIVDQAAEPAHISDDSDVDAQERKLGKMSEYIRKTTPFRSLLLTVMKLDTVPHLGRGEPKSRLKTALGPNKAQMETMVCGAMPILNAKFYYNFTGERYLRFIVEADVDGETLILGTVKFNLERAMFNKKLSTWHGRVRLRFGKLPQKLATQITDASEMWAYIEVDLNINPFAEAPCCEFTPLPSVFITQALTGRQPEEVVKKFSDAMKSSVEAKHIDEAQNLIKEDDAHPFLESFLNSGFQAPDVVDCGTMINLPQDMQYGGGYGAAPQTIEDLRLGAKLQSSSSEEEVEDATKVVYPSFGSQELVMPNWIKEIEVDLMDCDVPEGYKLSLLYDDVKVLIPNDKKANVLLRGSKATKLVLEAERGGVRKGFTSIDLAEILKGVDRTSLYRKSLESMFTIDGESFSKIPIRLEMVLKFKDDSRLSTNFMIMEDDSSYSSSSSLSSSDDDEVPPLSPVKASEDALRRVEVPHNFNGMKFQISVVSMLSTGAKKINIKDINQISFSLVSGYSKAVTGMIQVSHETTTVDWAFAFPVSEAIAIIGCDVYTKSGEIIKLEGNINLEALLLSGNPVISRQGEPLLHAKDIDDINMTSINGISKKVAEFSYLLKFTEDVIVSGTAYPVNHRSQAAAIMDEVDDKELEQLNLNATQIRQSVANLGTSLYGSPLAGMEAPNGGMPDLAAPYSHTIANLGKTLMTESLEVTGLRVQLGKIHIPGFLMSRKSFFLEGKIDAPKGGSFKDGQIFKVQKDKVYVFPAKKQFLLNITNTNCSLILLLHSTKEDEKKGKNDGNAEVVGEGRMNLKGLQDGANKNTKINIYKRKGQKMSEKLIGTVHLNMGVERGVADKGGPSRTQVI